MQTNVADLCIVNRDAFPPAICIFILCSRGLLCQLTCIFPLVATMHILEFLISESSIKMRSENNTMCPATPSISQWIFCCSLSSSCFIFLDDQLQRSSLHQAAKWKEISSQHAVTWKQPILVVSLSYFLNDIHFLRHNSWEEYAQMTWFAFNVPRQTLTIR